MAAVFVSPDKQGQGIGKALVNDAKNRRTELTLSVYYGL
ncbi:GNAT family N-acetyltransferase [Xenorhabdus thailandensis]